MWCLFIVVIVMSSCLGVVDCSKLGLTCFSRYEFGIVKKKIQKGKFNI